jgi:hypothetical protein
LLGGRLSLFDQLHQRPTVVAQAVAFFEFVKQCTISRGS